MDVFEVNGSDIENSGHYITVAEPSKKKYRCKEGHEVEGSFLWEHPLTVTLHGGSEGVLHSDYLCSHCIIKALNQSFGMKEVKSDG